MLRVLILRVGDNKFDFSRDRVAQWLVAIDYLICGDFQSSISCFYLFQNNCV